VAQNEASPPEKGLSKTGKRPPASPRSSSDAQIVSADSAEAFFEAWYRAQSWQPFPFQRQMLDAWGQGGGLPGSGLLNAPTGSGKTYAVWIPFLCHWMAAHPGERQAPGKGLKLLWITPLRALAKDIAAALQAACDAFDLDWRVELRTGDTKAARKQAQLKDPPQALVTTPESLHVLLARKGYPAFFKGLEAVVVDEWHELIGSKRGVQVELGLSRLRALREQQGGGLRVWGISATIGNLVQALEVLLGPEGAGRTEHPDALSAVGAPSIVVAEVPKRLEMRTVLPDDLSDMPWGGHLGIKLLEKVRHILGQANTTLIFTNTRAQAEIWYRKLLEAEPNLAGRMALHHGSLDREVRDWVEEALHRGDLKAVVCTSSLDLGVDFRPVDQVVQIGGPKGVARFMQRAGRSGHEPGAVSRIWFLPTYALELLEAAALQDALERSYVEKRPPMRLCFDVLVQYLVTLAVSEGFRAEALLPEIRNTYCFQDISDEEWQWCLSFITVGGKSLQAYDEYRRVDWDDGLFRVNSRRVAQRHRLHIGTIVGDNVMLVQWLSGGTLGSIEEYFAARLSPGDVFWFAGRALEFVRLKDMRVLVRKAKKLQGAIPAWGGGRMSFSSYLSDLLREQLRRMAAAKASIEATAAREEEAPEGSAGAPLRPELQVLQPLFAVQAERSRMPDGEGLLIETLESKEGFHCFVFPMEGRAVHEAMGGLVAWRMRRYHRGTFSLSMTDYGFELYGDRSIPIEKAIAEGVFSVQNLSEDLMASVNAAEMARRRFRDIAAISGLTFQGFPGRMKKTKHLQASAGLIYQVFADYDRDNLLFRQALDEVLVHQMEEARMRKALLRMASRPILVQHCQKPSPFAFPIMVERIREKVSTESLEERIRRMRL
jgi:ATP-dependent Lhr-like helicase